MFLVSGCITAFDFLWPRQSANWVIDFMEIWFIYTYTQNPQDYQLLISMKYLPMYYKKYENVFITNYVELYNYILPSWFFTPNTFKSFSKAFGLKAWSFWTHDTNTIWFVYEIAELDDNFLVFHIFLLFINWNHFFNPISWIRCPWNTLWSIGDISSSCISGLNHDG